METVDLEKLRVVAKNLFDRDVEAARKRFADRLKTLEDLAGELAMAGHGDGHAVAPRPMERRVGRPPGKGASRGTGKMGPTGAVREAIRHLPDGFTMPVIADWIEHHLPNEKIKRAHLSSALNKLKGMKEIAQIQEPQGRDPAVYNRVNGSSQLSLPTITS